MVPPLAISHVVMLCNAAEREASHAHMSTLLRDHHLPAIDAATSYARHNMGAYRVRWERHTEFVSWTFVTPLDDEPKGDPAAATESLPQAWLEGLPGQRLVALNLWAFAGTTQEDEAPDPRIVFSALQ